MSKEIYLLRTLKLKGANFTIYNKVPVSDDAKFVYEGGKLRRVCHLEGNWEHTRYYTISDKPEGYDMDKNKLLPYFAKVTEDLPGSARGLIPKVYERCQLTTEYPNNYLVFECTKTKEHLKIAMNSHYYEPIN